MKSDNDLRGEEELIRTYSYVIITMAWDSSHLISSHRNLDPAIGKSNSEDDKRS